MSAFKGRVWGWLKEQVQVPDGSGGWEDGGWINWRRVSLQVASSAAKQIPYADQIISDETFMFRMRYIPGVERTMRLELDDGRILQLVSVVNDKEQNRWLILRCEATDARVQP